MKTEKILVIDDNDDHRNAVQFLLEKEKYDVIAADNGKLGLKLLERDNDIRVLVVDLLMLGVSGTDVLEKIKNYPHSLRRIVLTAHEEELPSKDAKELKVFAYLNKPVRKHTLLFTIKATFKDLYAEQLEKELQLKKQFEEIGKMTTDFVHWVGNKVSLIPNYLDLIQEEVENLSESGSDRCKKIRKVVDDVNDMKANLLMPFKQTESEIILVDDIMDQTISTLKLPEDMFEKDYRLKSPLVTFNRVELQKVFEELINNALKAIENSTQKLLTISIQEGVDNKVVVKIKDTGCGIKEEDRDNIFRAFYSDKKSKGYGIGLFMVKNTLAKFGGTIEFDSKVREGTTFTIYLKKTGENVSSKFLDM